MSDKAYIEQFYLVGMMETLLVAVAVEEQRQRKWAEVNIPYRDPDSKIYGMTCYLYGLPHNQPAIAQMLLLGQFARLLALRGQARVDQFENVAAIHTYGAKPDDEVQAFCEFSRPQDFATRGLYGDDMPKWKYRLINYIVAGDMVIADSMGEHALKPNTSYIVNAWIDVPTDDEEMMRQFFGVFPMMSMHGAPDEVRPMRPTDCLRDDDFWDREKLGEPPARCPDEEW